MATPAYESKALIYCPSREPIPYPINYPTTWYAFYKTPEFRACSNCYQSMITGSGLEREFYPIVETMTSPQRFCNSNTPRVRGLVAQYRAQRSEHVLRQLEAHIAARVKVKPCKLDGIVKPEDDLDWHRLNASLDSCHACYEDFLAGSSFGSSVTPTTVKQPPTGMAKCDVGNAFIRRMASMARDYNQFLSAVAHRGQLPECEGASQTKATSRNWYRPKAPSLGNLVVCEKCYLDVAGGTQYAQTMFEQFNPASVKIKKFLCGFGASPALRANFGLMMASNDPGMFVRAAETLLTSPVCEASGIAPGTTWFTIHGLSSFGICAPCMACLVRPMRLFDTLLVPGTGPPLPGTVCAFNAANPRVLQYLKKMSEAAEKGQADIFMTAARHIATSPPCPRSKPAAGHRWTGTDVFSACADCARDVVFASPLAQLMTYRDASFPQPCKCDMYSPRVRDFWALASRAPDPRSGLDDFHAIMRHRNAVYREVYPQIEQGISIMEAQVEAHKRRLERAVAMQKLDSTMALDVNFGGPHSYTRYGNASMGYRFASQMGVEAAMDFNAAIVDPVIDPTFKAKLSAIERVWMEVE